MRERSYWIWLEKVYEKEAIKQMSTQRINASSRVPNSYQFWQLSLLDNEDVCRMERIIRSICDQIYEVHKFDIVFTHIDLWDIFIQARYVTDTVHVDIKIQIHAPVMHRNFMDKFNITLNYMDNYITLFSNIFHGIMGLEELRISTIHTESNNPTKAYNQALETLLPLFLQNAAIYLENKQEEENTDDTTIV